MPDRPWCSVCSCYFFNAILPNQFPAEWKEYAAGGWNWGNNNQQRLHQCNISLRSLLIVWGLAWSGAESLKVHHNSRVSTSSSFGQCCTWSYFGTVVMVGSLTQSTCPKHPPAAWPCLPPCPGLFWDSRCGTGVPLAQISMDVWQTQSWRTCSFLRGQGMLGKVTNMGDAGYNPQAAMRLWDWSESFAPKPSLACPFWKGAAFDPPCSLGVIAITDPPNSRELGIPSSLWLIVHGLRRNLRWISTRATSLTWTMWWNISTRLRKSSRGAFFQSLVVAF